MLACSAFIYYMKHIIKVLLFCIYAQVHPATAPADQHLSFQLPR